MIQRFLAEPSAAEQRLPPRGIEAVQQLVLVERRDLQDEIGQCGCDVAVDDVTGVQDVE